MAVSAAQIAAVWVRLLALAQAAGGDYKALQAGLPIRSASAPAFAINRRWVELNVDGSPVYPWEWVAVNRGTAQSPAWEWQGSAASIAAVYISGSAAAKVFTGPTPWIRRGVRWRLSRVQNFYWVFSGATAGSWAVSVAIEGEASIAIGGGQNLMVAPALSPLQAPANSIKPNTFEEVTPTNGLFQEGCIACSVGVGAGPTGRSYSGRVLLEFVPVRP
jgi:hypothetical protein